MKLRAEEFREVARSRYGVWHVVQRNDAGEWVPICEANPNLVLGADSCYAEPDVGTEPTCSSCRLWTDHKGWSGLTWSVKWAQADAAREALELGARP